MKVERFAVQTCCGKTAISLKLSSPLSKDFLPYLVRNGYVEAKHFTKSGMLYVENINLIATGIFGSDNLQIKCKVNNCDNFLKDFEVLLTNMG
jgi:hypothetical protein